MGPGRGDQELMAQWKLIIEDDAGKTIVVPLTRDEVTIGRKEGNTIRLTERNVSRFHAKLKKNPSSVVIQDLTSYNGIKINGDKIAGEIEVREGDLIEIGDYHLALQAEGAVEPAPEAIPTTPPPSAPGPLSLQSPPSPEAGEDDEFAGDTQRWEPPVAMDPVPVGLQTVDDQAALLDGAIPLQNPGPVSGVGAPTLDERPAISSAPNANDLPAEATVRNLSAPVAPAPGASLASLADDDQTEALPVALSTPVASPLVSSPGMASPSLASIEDEPTEAHPTSASGAVAPTLLDSVGPTAPPSLLASPNAGLPQPNTLPDGGGKLDEGATMPPPSALPPAASAPTLPFGTPALAVSPPAAGDPPLAAAPPASSPPALASAAPSVAPTSPPQPQAPPVQAPPPQSAPPPVGGEYTDVVRAAPGPRKQPTDVPRLAVINSVFAGSMFPLQAAELVIGRVEDNDVTIEHRSVSRHHAKVVKDGNGYRIVDLGSANGILLNGNETDGALLKSGDVIELGRIRLRYVPAGEVFELTPEDIARARKADALGEDEFENDANTAFINTGTSVPTQDQSSSTTLLVLIAATFVIILLMGFIIFLLMRGGATIAEDAPPPGPSVVVADLSGGPAGVAKVTPETPPPEAENTLVEAEHAAAEAEAKAPVDEPPAGSAPEATADPEATKVASGDSDPATKPVTATTPVTRRPAARKPVRRSTVNVPKAKELERASKQRLMNGDAKDALRLAREAVKFNPSSGEAHRLMGVAYEKLGNPGAAKRSYMRAVRERPLAVWVEKVKSRIAAL